MKTWRNTMDNISPFTENIVDSDSNYRSLVDRIKNLYDKSVYLTLVIMHGTLSPAK